jgi:hypothetical protein
MKRESKDRKKQINGEGGSMEMSENCVTKASPRSTPSFFLKEGAVAVAVLAAAVKWFTN